MRILGIDASHWDENVNWEKAAHGLGFVYFKCTDGLTWIDDKYVINANGLAAQHIPMAPYHFYQPNSSGKLQAEHFVRTAGTNYRKYVIDVEQVPNPPMSQYYNWLNLKTLLDRVEALASTIPAIYTGYYAWLEQMGSRGAAIRYDLLLAEYTYARNPTAPYPWITPKVWQFTDYGFWDGFVGALDLNWFYGTKLECQNYFGLKISTY